MHQQHHTAAGTPGTRARPSGISARPSHTVVGTPGAAAGTFVPSSRSRS